VIERNIESGCLCSEPSGITHQAFLKSIYAVMALESTAVFESLS